MGHWVTLDDGQKVFIGSGGRVLATRGAISSAAGGKERGKALAQRSQAAIGKALGKAKKREASYTVKAKQPIDKEGRYYPGGTTAVERDAMKRAAALREQRAAQQSPATPRAIEHARAAAAERPSLREQAEKAREERGISQGGRTALARALNRARSNIQHPPPIEAKSDKQQAYAQDVRAKQIEGIHKPRQLSNIEFARKTIAESTLRRGKLARESKASDIINVRDASSRAGAQAKKLVERFYEPAKYRSTQTFRSRLRSR